MIRRKVFSSYSEEDLISAIEERAFCEGYQAAQKEFAEEEDNGSSTRSKVLGYGALGAGAAALGGIGYGTKGAYDFKKTISGKNINVENLMNWGDRKINAEDEKFKKLRELDNINKTDARSKVLDYYAQDKTKQAIKNREGYTKLLEKAVKADPNNKLAAERLSAMNKVNRGIKAGAIGTLGAGALAAGYGISRYFDKKDK